MAETQKERIMRILKVSSEEADQIMADDKKIDRGEKMDFDLSPEQEKELRKYRQADRKPTVYNFNKPRERKPNATKSGIIEEIAKFLQENSQFSVENLEITNKERQIAFSVGENKSEFTLVQKRTPKK